MKSKKENLKREELVKLVRKWGSVTTEGLLDRKCLVFSIPEIEGFIGYKMESSHAVVLGDPVCSPEDKPLLAKAFDEECRRRGLDIVYTIVSQEFTEWAFENLSGVVIEFGKVIVLDPQNNPTKNTGTKGILVRNKVRRALSEGVVVKEYLGKDLDLEKKIEEVGIAWLKKRKGPQIYLAHLSLFEDRYGKRWFYAQKGDEVVGILIINKLESEGGWLLNTAMMIKDAPRGLSELLVISILETLEEEGCKVVLAGPIPSKQLGKIEGIGEIKSTLIRWVFKISRHIFNLDGHAVFWEKFQPEYRSSFLLFPHRNLRLSSIKAMMQAFNVEKG